ncbi:MAG: arginine--tRNA ligase [Syntrophales bacterium]|nr:arginine--tRNA ligase [Syntrophales bacterium]
MKKEVQRMLKNTLITLQREGRLSLETLPRVEVETAKEEAHGDYATNVAMVLASLLRRSPHEIAGMIVGRIQDEKKILDRVEVAGPGFINFFIKDDVWRSSLVHIEKEGQAYGTGDMGEGYRAQVEFVSANPTGPLHIGHARGAVVGDVIANILKASGYEVEKEYYINDAGNQIWNLGRSVYYRYLQMAGREVDFPETCYQGDYIKELAQRILVNEGTKFLEWDEDKVINHFADLASGVIMEGIKRDLRDFGVTFDFYFSERDLYRDGSVDRVITDLEARGFVYREDGTLWFRSTAFGDEKDRVIVRKRGEPTYFAADVAYHRYKFARGFHLIIDVWGADHHGYIPRLQAGIRALGYTGEALRVILVQMVNLLRDGKPVAMSTRAGEFVTLREVLDEVGRDAARYNFLMRRSDSHLDFDLEVAKKQSNENPVYYVQYAHARIASILRMAEERGITVPRFEETPLFRLILPEEMHLIKAAVRYPEVVMAAASALEPHRLTFYLNDLASVFHSYYNRYRVISDDSELTAARLFLVNSLRIVFRNCLGLLGVDAPDRM